MCSQHNSNSHFLCFREIVYFVFFIFKNFECRESSQKLPFHWCIDYTSHSKYKWFFFSNHTLFCSLVWLFMFGIFRCALRMARFLIAKMALEKCLTFIETYTVHHWDADLAIFIPASRQISLLTIPNVNAYRSLWKLLIKTRMNKTDLLKEVHKTRYFDCINCFLFIWLK